MTIFKRRYAVLGWLTFVMAKRLAKRKVRRLAMR
jgi:hypothetical protein